MLQLISMLHLSIPLEEMAAYKDELTDIKFALSSFPSQISVSNLQKFPEPRAGDPAVALWFAYDSDTVRAFVIVLLGLRRRWRLLITSLYRIHKNFPPQEFPKPDLAIQHSQWWMRMSVLHLIVYFLSDLDRACILQQHYNKLFAVSFCILGCFGSESCEHVAEIQGNCGRTKCSHQRSHKTGFWSSKFTLIYIPS